MLMPNKYGDAIKAEQMKRVIEFVRDGQFVIHVSDDLEQLSVDVLDMKPGDKAVMDAVKFLDPRTNISDMKYVAVFNQPGEFLVSKDEAEDKFIVEDM